MQYWSYDPAIEKIGEDEAETFQKIADTFTQMGQKVQEHEGRPVRVSHAKSTALLKGELSVDANLPPELAQGLFARPARYGVAARFAQGPGEILGDEVSTHRGLSVKVIGVSGARVEQSKEAATQDWLTEAKETAFLNADATRFLLNLKAGVSNAPKLSEGIKAAVSNVSRATNTALEAVGISSKTLGFFGHPPTHPLSENYFSQAPMRWGAFVAKLGFFPTEETTAGLSEIDNKHDFNAFRDAMIQYFTVNGAALEVRVQLATDEHDTPVENAAKRWPEDKTPYRRVGIITLPAQKAWSETKSSYFDELLSFQPANSLEDHRPLGQIMRARMYVYEQLVKLRQQGRVQKQEPVSLEDVPD